MKKIVFYIFILMLLTLVISAFSITQKSKATSSTTVTKELSINHDATDNDIKLGGNTDHIYSITGKLTINSNIPAGNTGVIFVGGNLLINPSSKKLTDGGAKSGLVFAVKGNVYIGKDVTEVDAVIISQGFICTAADFTDPNNPTCPGTNIQTPSPLLVNGSLVSIDQDPAHVCPDSCPLRFRRTLSDNIQPAEKIVHQVKYLVILRDMLADTYQKWSEVTNLASVPVGSTLPSLNSPPTLTSCSVGSNTATANVIQSYSFTNNAADSDGTITSYTINWGDNNTDTYLTNPVSPNAVYHTYSSVGTYATRMQVIDNKNAQSSTINCGTVNVNSQNLSVILGAHPQTGTAPLATALDASDGGTAGGYITYSYWWNCSNTGVSVSAAETACGTLPSLPALHSCSTNSVGAKCYASFNSVSNTYSSGTYTAKVIIERGGYSATDSKTITVSP